MGAPETQVRIDRKDGVSLIRYEGDITSFSEEAVLGSFRELKPEEHARILLDFSGVEYINSSGIALIITLLMEGGKQGQAIHCFGLSDHFRRVFEMVGLMRYTTLHPSEEEGIAGLNA